MRKISRNQLILWAVLLIPYLSLIPAFLWYNHVLQNVQNSTFLIISKQDMTLYQYNYKGDLLQKSKIATGKIPGDKQSMGDLKTPEGVFKIGEIEDASGWSHDFKDSLGPIKGAYGPYFINLDIPGQKGIGIHGTHDNNSIGTRASEGCIRMHNAELIQLVHHLATASVVVITPGIEDVLINVDSSSADLNAGKDKHEAKPRKIKKK